MISRIIRFSVNHQGIVLIAIFMAAILGWHSFQSLPIDAVPDITNVQVQINSPVDGLAPVEIERGITFPIETAMSGIAGVEQVRSITRFGLSQVTVTFEEGTDIYRARQLVSERLQGVRSQLPIHAKPSLGPVSSGLGEIYHYTVEAKSIAQGDARTRQLMEIRAIQDWFIKPRLLTVKGVAEVNTIGGYEKQFYIQPNPQLVSRFGIHFSDIKDAVDRTNQNVGGGYVQQTGEQFLIQAVGLLKNIGDIRSIPVKSLETLKTVTIGDVAEVVLAKEMRTGAALVEGKEAVVGTVLMLLGENSRTTALRVAERVHEIQAMLPAPYKLVPLYDRSVLVNATLGTVEHNLIAGAALVVIILLLLVGNLRAAVITALTIPLSLLITFIAMKQFGLSGNLMSLGALDFGIIVDGVVIVLDNCVRFVHEKTRELGRSLNREELKTAVYDASVEIRTAAGFGELVIVAVFLPVFALVGIEGKMFKPMAATFALAVVAALILSFTAAPALASLLLTGKVKDHEPWLMRQIRRLYKPLLLLSLKFRLVTIGVGVLAIALGVVAFARLGGEFLPQLDEGSSVFQFVRPVNISLDQSVALQEKSEGILIGFPEVQHVFSRIGTGEVATDPMGVNLSDTFVMLKPRDAWPVINGSKRSKLELTSAMTDALNSSLPGQRILLSQPIQMRFNDLLEGTRADVSVKVFGDDMDKLAELTHLIAGVIAKIPGAGEVETELRGKSPLLKIVPKEGILKTLGVSNREVLETVGIALGGEQAGFLYEGIQRFPIFIRLSDKDRADLPTIRRLPIGIQSNATIPLSEAATATFDETYSSISREQAKRRAAVLINPQTRDTEGFVKRAQNDVDRSVKLPPGYYLEWGGNFKNLQTAKARLMVLTPLVFLLILMMVYAAFKNVWQTGLIFLGVPLALFGGVLGLIGNGLPFSISAGIGFVALSGIAVLNGVVLVSYFNELKTRGMRGRELVLEGTLIRLRPVLMTALVDIFGFLPMMLSTGMGAEVQRPLASVVIGGIVSSTLLTLIVLPNLFLMFEAKMDSNTP